MVFWCVLFHCRIMQRPCKSTHSSLMKMNPTKPIYWVELGEFTCRLYLWQYYINYGCFALFLFCSFMYDFIISNDDSLFLVGSDIWWLAMSARLSIVHPMVVSRKLNKIRLIFTMEHCILLQNWHYWFFCCITILPQMPLWGDILVLN